ncbi:hypothetical protein CFC21_069426 [Triticum aestivum]|uniref:Uncharacterized protein n=3 Tax=Triticum TaxID=4564 RepID=A0A9R1AFF3_TRITD|nr:hypothetical protein CFC21_069426 [Triticum aestivum]VAI26125.1 unnamed protein product [Triticum turgidum subsp. durum]
MASHWFFFLSLCLLPVAVSSIDVEPPLDSPHLQNQALIFGEVCTTKDCREVLRRVGDETCIISYMCASIG